MNPQAFSLMSESPGDDVELPALSRTAGRDNGDSLDFSTVFFCESQGIHTPGPTFRDAHLPIAQRVTTLL